MLFAQNQLIEEMIRQVPAYAQKEGQQSPFQEKMKHDVVGGKNSEAFLNVQSLTNEIFPAMNAWREYPQNAPTKASHPVAVADGPQELDSIADDIQNLAPCVYASKNAIFVLSNVSLGYSDLTPMTDSSQQIVQEEIGTNSQTVVTFNFCQEKFNEVPSGCGSYDNSFAFVQKNGQQGCYPLLPSKDGDPTTEATDIMDGNSEDVNGLKLTYTSGYETCPSDSSKPLKLTVNLECSTNTKLEPVGDNTITDHCDIELTYKSNLGCPKFQYGILAKFMTKYSFLWGGVFIFIGLVLSFCGNRLLTIVIAIVSCLVTIVIGVYFTSRFVDAVFSYENIKDYAVWIILALWGIIGLLVGYLMVKKIKWGIALMGAFGGINLGLLLTTVVGPALSNAIIYYAIIIGCGIVAFIITFYVEKPVIIISTSFIGSYMIIRGISMYAGGYPNETELHAMAKDGFIDWSTFPKTFYAYLAGIVILTIGSAVFQWKNNKEEKEPKRGYQ